MNKKMFLVFGLLVFMLTVVSAKESEIKMVLEKNSLGEMLVGDTVITVNEPVQDETYTSYEIEMDIETNVQTTCSYFKSYLGYCDGVFCVWLLRGPHNLTTEPTTEHTGVADLSSLPPDRGGYGIYFMCGDGRSFPKFYINTSIQDPLEELEERVTVLESLFDGILNQITNLLDRLGILENRVDELEKSQGINYFEYMSFNEREKLVCSYMKDNGLNDFSDLGLRCKSRYITPTPFDVKDPCRCVSI